MRTKLFVGTTFFLFFLMLLATACKSGKPEQISCVTPLDCPYDWYCEDGWCVEFPDAEPSDSDAADRDMPSDADQDSDGGTDSDTDNDADTDSDADSDTDADGDTPVDVRPDEDAIAGDSDEFLSDIEPSDDDSLLVESDTPPVDDTPLPDDDIPVADDAPVPDDDVVVPYCGDGKNAVSEGLVLYLRMDEPALFSTIYDSSPDPVNGKFSTGAALGNTGVRGNALAFNQSSNLQVADMPKLDLAGAMSVAAWVYLPYDASNIRPYMLVGKGSGHQANFVLWREAGRKVSFVFHNWIADGICCGATSTSDIDDSAWHYVAGTYDGANARIYVDGVLQTTSDACSIVPLTNNDPVTIGQVSPNIGYTDPYATTGYIDEVRIYNRALSAGEITLLKDGAHEFCDDGSGSGDGCTDTCEVEPGRICYGSPSTCIATPTWSCTHSVQICDSAYDYMDSSYYEYYYQSWIGTTLTAYAAGAEIWTSPAQSTWYSSYTAGALCSGTWSNYTFTNGQTVELNYTAQGSYSPNQCYFQVQGAAGGAGAAIAATSPTGSGQSPANYAYTGTCLQP